MNIHAVHTPARAPTFSATLGRGVMDLWVDTADLPVGDLLDMAERHNPKRAFLFVSRLLGRHIPACPLLHTQAANALADKAIDGIAELGTVAVMGFAETAVGLGAGVHEALAQRLGDRVAPYMPSTRHPECGPSWFAFSEDHSHATAHHVLEPATPEGAAAVRGATTLVLVDDEATTGATFTNLVSAAIAAGMGGVESIVLVCYTDWSRGQAEAAVRAATQGRCAVRCVSLATGGWSWTPHADLPPLPPNPLPPAPLNLRGVDAGLGDWRRGIPATPKAWDVEGILARTPVLDAGATACLAIGTGEYVWNATRFARTASLAGTPTKFLATTRSPILPGGAITTKASFPDHYGAGCWMFVHNARAQPWRHILLFVEREDALGVPQALAQHLERFAVVTPSGRVLPFAHGDLCA